MEIALSVFFWDGIVNFFHTLMTPLYWVISGLLVLFHALWAPLLGADSGWTWVLSIVSLTAVVRAALIPLFVKQINSSRAMQVFAPELKAIQEKYRGDQQRLGQETMKLYRERGINPMAGCFPLLLQMPIFFALFNVLNSTRIPGQALGGWLQSRPDLVESLSNSEIFGAKLSLTFLSPTNGQFAFGPVQIVAAVLIITMVGAMFVTQLQLMRKNMPASAMTGQMAQIQKFMLYLLPLVFLIGGINFPIGLMIYWLTSTLWTLGQQWIVIRNNPMPDTPAYAAWEVRQKLKGKTVTPPGQTVTKNPTAQPEDPNRPQRQPQRQPRKQSRSQRKQSRAKRRPDPTGRSTS